MQNSDGMTSHFLKDMGLSIAVPEAFVSLVSAVSDVAVIVDAKGEIQDILWNIDEVDRPDLQLSAGLRMEDIVTEESRPKVRAMMDAARAGEDPRWRELNHLFGSGLEIPVRCQAIAVGEHVIFLGREMRAVAQLQSRLVEAQRVLDEDYGRRRQLETRYRVLFQTSTEPLLIADARQMRIQAANAAAGRMLDVDPDALVGQRIEALFASPGGGTNARETLQRIVATGTSETIRGTAKDTGRPLEIRPTVFREADAMMLLCRLDGAGRTGSRTEIDEMVLGLVSRVPDAMVLTNAQGSILWANDAFLGLAEVALVSHAKGTPLSRFLGRPGVDMDVIIGNAREHGRLRAFNAQLVGAFGSTTRVEISVAMVPEAGEEIIGFVMRDITRHDQAPSRPNGASAESAESLMQLVGSVPLKELVRSSTEEIEKLCIETALKMTGNNRASAAEMLGLSRQSLYVKLRRFGLIDASTAD